MGTTIPLEQDSRGNFRVGDAEVSFDGIPPIDVTVLNPNDVRIGIPEGIEPTPQEIAKAIAEKIYPNASEEAINRCAQSLLEERPTFFSEGRLVKSNTKTVIPAPQECIEGLYSTQDVGTVTAVQDQNLLEDLRSFYAKYDSYLNFIPVGLFIVIFYLWIQRMRNPRYSSDPPSSVQYAQHSSTPPIGIQQEEPDLIKPQVQTPNLAYINSERNRMTVQSLDAALGNLKQTELAVVKDLFRNDEDLARTELRTQEEVAGVVQVVQGLQKRMDLWEKAQRGNPKNNRI